MPMENQIATETNTAVQVPKGGPTTFIRVPQRLAIAAAKLWSPESPHLYKVVSVVKRGEQIIDEYETPFGIRTIEFTTERGVLVNGQHIEIKGTCNHQDHAGRGKCAAGPLAGLPH